MVATYNFGSVYIYLAAYVRFVPPGVLVKITSASVTNVSGSGGFDILLMAYKVLPNT